MRMGIKPNKNAQRNKPKKKKGTGRRSLTRACQSKCVPSLNNDFECCHLLEKNPFEFTSSAVASIPFYSKIPKSENFVCMYKYPASKQKCVAIQTSHFSKVIETQISVIKCDAATRIYVLIRERTIFG